MERIQLDVYGQFDLLIEKSGEQVAIYRTTSDGKQTRISDLVIPCDADVDEIVDLVDIAFHELARPGDAVKAR